MMSRPKEWLPFVVRCEVCGESFDTVKHEDGRVKRRLCSQRCAAAAAQAHRRGGRSQPMTKTCEVCDLKFEARTSYQIEKQRCCSRECFLKLLPSFRRKPKVIAKCERCGVEVVRNQSQVRGATFCSNECRGAWDSEHGTKAGDNNGQWKGGSSAWWKQKARERDDFTCQVDGCFVRDEGQRTHAHHKLPREAGGPDELDNLITLCNEHHRMLEHRLYVMFLERHPKEAAQLVQELYAPG